MTQWSPVPPMVLSSRANRLFSVPTLARVAREAGTQGLDLDLAGRAVTLAGLSSGPEPGPDLIGQIAAVWLPLNRPPRMAGHRVDHQLNDWIRLTLDAGARRVVVDREAALRPLGEQDKRPLLLRLQDALGAAASVTVVLRPAQLEGTRAHLATLGALRRTAEEWDFDLALDLLGTVDPRWEAEAALQRLGSRLSLVRLPVPHDVPATAGRSRLTSRTVSYLLDQSYAGTLSLVPRLPWTGLFSVAVLERRTRDATSSVVERHQRIFAPARTPTWLSARPERQDQRLG